MVDGGADNSTQIKTITAITEYRANLPIKKSHNVSTLPDNTCSLERFQLLQTYEKHPYKS